MFYSIAWYWKAVALIGLGLWSSLAPAFERLHWHRCPRQDSPTIANLCQADDPQTWAPDDGEVFPPPPPSLPPLQINVFDVAMRSRRGLIPEFHNTTIVFPLAT